MVKFVKYYISTNYGVAHKPMREAVRKIDSIESENNYLLEKFPEHYELIEK